MGFFAILFGVYGGGEVPVVEADPRDGWVAPQSSRVWAAPETSRVWVGKITRGPTNG